MNSTEISAQHGISCLCFFTSIFSNYEYTRRRKNLHCSKTTAVALKATTTARTLAHHNRNRKAPMTETEKPMHPFSQFYRAGRIGGSVNPQDLQTFHGSIAPEETSAQQ
jgi:hypothetical protein